MLFLLLRLGALFCQSAAYSTASAQTMRGLVAPTPAKPSAPVLLLCLGALILAVGVGLGAFGAHALRAMVDASALATWHTAVLYQLLHGLGLLLIAAKRRVAHGDAFSLRR